MLRRNNPPPSGLFDAMIASNDHVQADRIRGLTSALSNQGERISDAAARAKNDVARLQAEVDFLSLIVASLMKTLADKGLATTPEVLARLEAADAADGVKDGKITSDAFRAILGVPRPAPPPQQVSPPQLRRNR